jgi:hypothetical protein
MGNVRSRYPDFDCEANTVDVRSLWLLPKSARDQDVPPYLAGLRGSSFPIRQGAPVRRRQAGEAGDCVELVEGRSPVVSVGHVPAPDLEGSVTILIFDPRCQVKQALGLVRQ